MSVIRGYLDNGNHSFPQSGNCENLVRIMQCNTNGGWYLPENCWFMLPGDRWLRKAKKLDPSQRLTSFSNEINSKNFGDLVWWPKPLQKTKQNLILWGNICRSKHCFESQTWTRKFLGHWFSRRLTLYILVLANLGLGKSLSEMWLIS